MIGFSFEYDPRPALSMLDRIIGAMRDLSPFYEQVLEPDFYEMQARRFSTEGGEDPWARLSDQYAAWKARHFPGQPILVATGALRAGLTSQGGAGNVRRIDATTMEVGTSDPKAPFHQFGTSRMPRRQVIDFTGTDERRWQDLAERYFERIAKEAGA